MVYWMRHLIMTSAVQGIVCKDSWNPLQCHGKEELMIYLSLSVSVSAGDAYQSCVLTVASVLLLHLSSLQSCHITAP